jgi:hypothetical protein
MYNIKRVKKGLIFIKHLPEMVFPHLLKPEKSKGWDFGSWCSRNSDFEVALDLCHTFVSIVVCGEFFKTAGAIGAFHLRNLSPGQDCGGLVDLAWGRFFRWFSQSGFDMPGPDVVTDALNHLWVFPCGDTIDGN